MIPAGTSPFRPMLATPADQPFNDAAWAFEVKWDGLRALATVEAGRLSLQSRSGVEISSRYPELAELAAGPEVVLDGEIIAAKLGGQPDFSLLQQRMQLEKPLDIQAAAWQIPVVYIIFDILWLEGVDQRGEPFRKRRRLLEEAIRLVPTCLRSPLVPSEGEVLFHAACEQGLEGIVAKRWESTYQEGRSRDWLKIKSRRELDCLIAGFTQSAGRPLGALVLGLYRDRELVGIGQVGSGLDARTTGELLRLLAPLERERSPFPVPPKTHAPPRWVEPRLVCQVSYAEWTAERSLRHPVFVRLRPDKSPEDCLYPWEGDSSEVSQDPA